MADAIFIVNANGTGLVKLTNPLIIDSLPTWSPDGTRIAFIRSLNGIPTEVFVMNTNGAGQTDVFSVPLTEQLSDIEWAPDGSQPGGHHTFRDRPTTRLDLAGRHR